MFFQIIQEADLRIWGQISWLLGRFGFFHLQSGLSRIACTRNKSQTRHLSSPHTKPARSLPILPSATLKAGSGKGRKQNLKSSDINTWLPWFVQQRNQQHETPINLCVQNVNFKHQVFRSHASNISLVVFPTSTSRCLFSSIHPAPCARWPW